MNLNELQETEFRTTVRRDRVVPTGESQRQETDNVIVDGEEVEDKEGKEILESLRWAINWCLLHNNQISFDIFIFFILIYCFFSYKPISSLIMNKN